jgi:hypothetical protein
MQIQLDIDQQGIRLTTPVCSLDSSLGRALTAQTWLGSWEQVYSQLKTGKPCTVTLALASWRHWLKRIEHYYSYHCKEEKPANTDSLIWVIAGQEYPSVQTIPAFDDRLHDVGAFKLSQDRLVAIDSCYNRFRDGVELTACPGNWTAKALIRDEWNGFGVAMLAVAHETCEVPLFARETYEQEPVGNAGVDSGTCGFFDQAKYPLAEKEHEHEDGTFYKACCDLTDCQGELGSDTTRLFPVDVMVDGSGVNSRTLIGDGGYNCFIRKNNEGQVIAAVLVFDYRDKVFGICDEDEED